jgi:formylglycine-generating enzyme required for sulfatase activity
MNFAHGDSVDTAFANFAYKGIRIGTQPVGSYPPNGFGLYDMTGNVREWVYDYYDKDYYQNSPYNNPQGPAKGSYRVVRDGGWHSGSYCCRTYVRISLPSEYWRDFAIGFRCARNLDRETEKQDE